MKLKWKDVIKRETDTSYQKIWESVCEGYRVVESTIKFGEPQTAFYAMFQQPNGWRIISKHRTQNAAEKICHQRSKGE